MRYLIFKGLELARTQMMTKLLKKLKIEISIIYNAHHFDGMWMKQ